MAGRRGRRARRRAGGQERRNRRKINRRWLKHCDKFGMPGLIERLRRWLLRRDRLRGCVRKAIAAASPGLVRAIGDHRLAFGQPYFLACPEDAVAHPVGNVSQLVAIETHNPRLRHIEIRIVTGGDRIPRDRVFQLLPALHPSRDHRVRINWSREKSRIGAVSRGALRRGRDRRQQMLREMGVSIDAEKRHGECQQECNNVCPTDGPDFSAQLTPDFPFLPPRTRLQF